MNSKKIRCIVCQSDNLRMRFTNKDIIDKRSYTYYSCNECRLMFIMPFPKMERLKEIYSFKTKTLEKNANKLLFLIISSPFSSYFFNLFGQRIVKERAAYSKRNAVRKEKLIIDFGCGFAEFLKEMEEMKWKVVGQEISQKCISLSRKILGKNAVLTSVSMRRYKIPHGVSVITFWHVFEHLTDYDAVLSHISKSVKSKTILIIETPNAQSLSIRLFGKNSPMIITPEHLTFWSKDSFTILMKKNDFVVDEVLYPKTFIFTTSSSFYNYIQGKYNIKLVSLLGAIGILPISILIYFIFPKCNESIRVKVRKV